MRNFTATADGKPTRILSIKTPADEQIVLIVLDLTGDISLVDPAKEGLLSAIRRLPSTIWVGLLRAQDGLKVLADPTADREAVADSLQSLPISGRPGLLETVEAAGRIADSMAQKSSVRLTVLYVTDSQVENYREDFANPVINSSDPHDLSRKFPEVLIQEKISKLQGILSSQQMPLFIVHLRYLTQPLNEAYQNGLKQLAESTAGASAFCRSSAEIPDAIQKAFDTISAQYVLTLQLPEKRPPGIQIRLTAVDAQGEDSTLSYRSRLVLKEKYGDVQIFGWSGLRDSARGWRRLRRLAVADQCGSSQSSGNDGRREWRAAGPA